MLSGPTGWAGAKLLFYFGRHSFGSFQYSRLASSPASYIPYTRQWLLLSLFTIYWYCLQGILAHPCFLINSGAKEYLLKTRQLSICWVLQSIGSRRPCRSTRWDYLLRTSCVVAVQMETAPAKSSFGYSLVVFTKNSFIAAVTDLPWAGRQSKDCGFDQYANPEDHDLILRMNTQQKLNIPCNDNSWGHGEGMPNSVLTTNSQKLTADLQEMPRSHVFHPTKANLVPRSLFREPISIHTVLFKRGIINISLSRPYHTRSGGGKKWQDRLESCQWEPMIIFCKAFPKFPSRPLQLAAPVQLPTSLFLSASIMLYSKGFTLKEATCIHKRFSM